MIYLTVNLLASLNSQTPLCTTCQTGCYAAMTGASGERRAIPSARHFPAPQTTIEPDGRYDNKTHKFED